MMSREWLSWAARCKGDDSEPHLKYTAAIEMLSAVLCIKPAGTPGEVLHSPDTVLALRCRYRALTARK